MDGHIIIDRARKRRTAWATIYQPYVKLYNVIKQFIDRDYFGVIRWSVEEQRWVPMHVNSDKNPFPVEDYFGRRCRRLFGQRDMLCHAHASPDDEFPHFSFLVNSPNKPYALICFDFDGKDYGKASAIRSNMFSKYLSDIPRFEEPSRNRNGCYAWLIVERTSSPAAFNQLCNALSLELRRRFHDLGDIIADDFNERRDQRVNFFDGIKATCHFDDRDEIERLYADSDGNPNDNNRGLLATMPCSGFMNDEDGGMRFRMKQFVRFAERRKKKYINAVPESRLHELLAVFRPISTALSEPDSPYASASPSLHQLVPYESYGEKRERQNGQGFAGKVTQREARERLLDKAKWHENPLARMRCASCLFFYEMGRYADTPVELVRYYERLNLHTGGDEGNRRIARAATALDKHKSDAARPGNGIFFDANDWVPVVETWVTQEVRTHGSRRYRYAIEDELLAAALCLFTGSLMKPHRSDWMFTVGQTSQFDWYKKLADAGVLKAKFKDKNKRVDVVKMLQLAGLIVLRDGNHKYGGKEYGVSDKFGLGVNHPFYAQFVSIHGHVVDPKSLSCIVHYHNQKIA
jgi:hypothetical protein